MVKNALIQSVLGILWSSISFEQIVFRLWIFVLNSHQWNQRNQSEYKKIRSDDVKYHEKLRFLDKLYFDKILVLVLSKTGVKCLKMSTWKPFEDLKICHNYTCKVCEKVQKIFWREIEPQGGVSLRLILISFCRSWPVGWDIQKRGGCGDIK